MNRITIPTGYRPVLDEYDTQRAIEHIKRTFQREFAAALNLKRVSAPLFVTGASGLNDNLNGVERPLPLMCPHSTPRRRWYIRLQSGSAWRSNVIISAWGTGCTPT